MLDIIFGNRNLDISLAYNGTTGMTTLLKTIATSGSFTFASTEASKRAALQKGLDTVIQKILTIDD